MTRPTTPDTAPWQPPDVPLDPVLRGCLSAAEDAAQIRPLDLRCEVAPGVPVRDQARLAALRLSGCLPAAALALGFTAGQAAALRARESAQVTERSGRLFRRGMHVERLPVPRSEVA